MHKIQYMAIVDEFKTRAKIMREAEMPAWAITYMEGTVEMLTDPMPEDADQMIDRTVEVQQFAREAMMRQQFMFKVTHDMEHLNRAEILTAISFGLAMGRSVAMALIGMEDI